MLRGVPPLVSGDLLWALDSMGHGDDLALVDRNFPAVSVALESGFKRLIRLDGADTNAAAEAILRLFPLDTFVDAPLTRMEVVDEPHTVLEVHRDMHAIAENAEGKPVTMGSLERHAFYAAAKRAFVVVQTVEARPYGCFLLKKGVIFD